MVFSIAKSLRLTLESMNDITFLGCFSSVDFENKTVIIKPNYFRVIKSYISHFPGVSGFQRLVKLFKVLCIERLALVSSNNLKSFLLKEMSSSFFCFKNILNYYKSKNYSFKNINKLEKLRSKSHFETKSRLHYEFLNKVGKYSVTTPPINEEFEDETEPSNSESDLQEEENSSSSQVSSEEDYEESETFSQSDSDNYESEEESNSVELSFEEEDDSEYDSEISEDNLMFPILLEERKNQDQERLRSYNLERSLNDQFKSNLRNHVRTVERDMNVKISSYAIKEGMHLLGNRAAPDDIAEIAGIMTKYDLDNGYKFKSSRLQNFDHTYFS